jgi:phenylpropionate dioxygenase-like ring-hydroxylating dioxygenase large terminal subunit
VALSLGFIEDDILHFGYHGWAYDGTGACVEIPSLAAGSPIPSKAPAITHAAEERYGLVWVSLKDPTLPVPSFPDEEWDRPDFRTFVSHHYQWHTSAGHAVENFMDISHYLREELHLRVPDASGIAHRRFLGQIRDAAPILP